MDENDFGAAVQAARGKLTLTNATTGVLDGSVVTFWHSNLIDNSGVIDSVVRADLAYGFFDNITKMVDLDRDGNFADTADGGAILESQLGSLKIIGSTVNNKGTINGIDYNYFGVLYHMAVDFSSFNDVFTNSGTVHGGVHGDGGNDVLSNSGTLHGSLVGGEGKDKITNSGTVNGGLYGDNGDDTIINTKLINGGVNMGAGDDTFTNSGTVTGSVATLGGAVKDVIDNKGTIGGQIVGDAGVDVLINTGKIGTETAGPLVVSVYLYEGADTLTNKGTIYGGVVTGIGADVVTNSGLVTGWIDLGADGDTFTGGKFTDMVIDGAGADTVSLGDGNDWLKVTADSDVDHYDGGKGIDTLDLTGLSGVIVHLDKGEMTTAGVKDTVTGWEVVLGSAVGDGIVGSIAKETLKGGAGTDEIVGRGGMDNLWGGADEDEFIYFAASDSGATKATRDVIWDFEQGVGGVGGDKIYLSFDALSSTSSYDTFHSVGAGAAPLGVGWLSYMHKGTQTIVSADVTGDGKFDFSIALEGHFTLTIDDFSFF